MAEHTAGPWSFEGPDMFGDFNVLHPADCGAVAAVVNNGRPAGEVLANARLIAAAPDLLAACENVLAHARRHTDGTARLDAAWLDDVRAALAKVRGGNP
jgi:hypothetical protein